MVLKIFLSLIFLFALSLFVFFVWNILMPALKNQMLQNANPIFSAFEQDYVHRTIDEGVKISQMKAAVLSMPRKIIPWSSLFRLEYKGVKNCAVFNYVYGSHTENAYDCIGFGDCAAVCPQEAIVIENKMARVTNVCCGCGACVAACPKGLIELIPKEQQTVQFKNCLNNPQILEISSKKGFKFFQKCYKMLCGGR